MKIRPVLAAAATRILQEWVQDDEGWDEDFGCGGACDAISAALADVVSSHIDDVEITEGGQPGDDHAWIVVRRGSEVYGVDIHPSVYESGAGYSWAKTSDQVLSGDIDIFDSPWPDADIEASRQIRLARRLMSIWDTGRDVEFTRRPSFKSPDSGSAAFRVDGWPYIVTATPLEPGCLRVDFHLDVGRLGDLQIQELLTRSLKRPPTDAEIWDFKIDPNTGSSRLPVQIGARALGAVIEYTRRKLQEKKYTCLKIYGELDRRTLYERIIKTFFRNHEVTVLPVTEDPDLFVITVMSQEGTLLR